MNNTRRYIKEQLKKGVSEHDILEALKQAGHEPTAAKHAIKETQKTIKRLHRVIVALAALLAIAVVLLIATNTDQAPTTPNQEQPPQLTDEELLAQAVQQNNITICEEITGDYLRGECEAEFSEPEAYQPTPEEQTLIQAIRSGDPTRCEELNESLRSECEAEFSQPEAPQPSTQEEIILQAIQENDITICEELEDEYWRSECEAELR